MWLIFNNSFKLLLKKLPFILIISGVTFIIETINIPPIINGIFITIISLLTYIVIMEIKSINLKTISKYLLAFFAIYIIYILLYGVSSLITSLLFFGLLNFNILVSKEMILKINLIAEILLPLYAFARAQVILPSILANHKLSLSNLATISYDKYYKWVIISTFLYFPLILSSYENENLLVRALIYSILIPFICIFNTSFYKSKS